MSRKRDRPERLADKLRAIRQHLALSQTDMKKRLDFKGNYGRISEYELGKRQPNVSVLLAYARAAFVPMEYLVDDDVDLRRFRDALLETRADQQSV